MQNQTNRKKKHQKKTRLITHMRYLRGVSTPQPWPGAERCLRYVLQDGSRPKLKRVFTINRSDARLCRQFTLPHRKLRPADSTRLAKAAKQALPSCLFFLLVVCTLSQQLPPCIHPGPSKTAATVVSVTSLNR